jgi:DNA-directed RNA polymerase subunit M/transcription elongation factor TFIIS
MNIFKKLFKNLFDADKKIYTIKQHKEFTESQPCPKCHNKKLNVQLLEEGKKGYELAFECTACSTRGVLSHNGFRVDFTRQVEVKAKQ